MTVSSARADWAKARRAEIEYAAQLRKIARAVGHIIRGFHPEDTGYASEVMAALRRYADLIAPWARSAARRMIAEVAARSDKEWRKVSEEMGLAFRVQFSSPDEIGFRFRSLLDDQIGLIQSIPIEAAKRVHEQIAEGVVKGKRFSEVAKEIQASSGVSLSKATLIARTETGRVTTALTQARAESVGSVAYHWMTMNDAQVRPSHRAMRGKIVYWNDPPTLDGLTGHAGTVPNCRCYAAPIIEPASLPRRFMATAA